MLVIGEALAFFQSRDLILAYPEFGKRLATSLSFTMGNIQLVQWLLCLVVLALPFAVSRGESEIVGR